MKLEKFHMLWMYFLDIKQRYDDVFLGRWSLTHCQPYDLIVGSVASP